MKIKYKIFQFVILLILMSSAIIFTTIKMNYKSREQLHTGVSEKLLELQQLSVSELENVKKVADEGIVDASGLVTIDKVTDITLENQKNYNTIVNNEIGKASKKVSETLSLQQAAVSEGLEHFLGDATDAVSQIIKHDNDSFAVLSNAALSNVDYLQSANGAGLERFKHLKEKFSKKQLENQQRINRAIDSILVDILVSTNATHLTDEQNDQLAQTFENLKKSIADENSAYIQQLFSELDRQKSILTQEATIVARNVKWAINNQEKISAQSQREQTKQVLEHLLDTQAEINKRASTAAEQVATTIDGLRTELPSILQAKGRETNSIIFSQINEAKKDTEAAQVIVGKRIEQNTKNALGAFESAIDESQGVIDSSLQASLKKTTNLSVFIAVASVLLAAFLGYVMIKSISQPISKVLDFADRLSKGDITERLPEGTDELGEMSAALNKMADELADLQQATIDSFNQTLDQVLDCVFIFDPQTLRFIYVNQGATEHLQYTREELFQLTPLTIKPEFEEGAFRELLKPLIKKDIESHHFQTIHRTKTGKDIPVEILLKYACPPRNSPRFVAIVRDISERIAQQKENERIQTELLQKQKLESVGQLAAGLSHEINTPTQFISTNIEFLTESFDEISDFMTSLEEDSEKWPDSAKKLLDEVIEELDWEYLSDEIPDALTQSKDGIDRVITLVSAMKRFSHPGSKEKTNTDIHEIIDTALTVSRNEWRYAAELKIDYDETIPEIPMLVDEMGQVIINMIINASHAMQDKFGEEQEGELKGKITVSTCLAGEHVQVSISDNGVGIDEDTIKKVFDPFFTTKSVGKGTGQGLAICHDVITKKHQGKLEVKSEKNIGTTFIISLPIEVS